MAEMEGLAKMMLEMKEMMEKSSQEMNDRLAALESGSASASGKESAKGDEKVVIEIPADGTIPKLAEIVSPPREKQLSKNFGVDCSANALLEFLDHYQLCRDMNRQRGISGWNDGTYRARELRFQLQGEAAVYLRQEEAMAQSWVFDDEAIIEKLKERWLNRDCIEMDILEFEEARQGEFETLPQFMQRLKGLGQRAFAEFDPNGMHQRIIWRFLDGVRDKDIRAAIIKERWMKDRRTPKSYDEVLKIATNAHMTKVAAGATGGGSNSSGKANVAVVNNSPRIPRGNKGKANGMISRADAPRGLDCFYCHQRHSGGWRECSKRKKENPEWTPRSDRSVPSGSSSRGSTRPSTPASPQDSNSSMHSINSEKSFRDRPSL